MAALAPTSPAASVGTAVGTPVTGIGEAPVPDGGGDHPFARITAIETRLAAQPADAALSLHVGAGRVVDIMPRPGCVSDFRVEANEKPGAVADGRMILVTQELVDFSPDDAELAAAIAHDLAQHILRPRPRSDDPRGGKTR